MVVLPKGWGSSCVRRVTEGTEGNGDGNAGLVCERDWWFERKLRGEKETGPLVLLRKTGSGRYR